MMEEEIKYEDAVKELEAIVRCMENDELDIDSLAAQLKRAQQLVTLCKEKLACADKQINELLEQGNEK
ncbi:MAG TPA: exodeoxyribonuclease VII small subunit [Candidatus Prevotella avicola]|uniref:Exodeoxyribonuclease 7 small subunit n=1 Tax=Candidatus Prevotella avicola TaxID=2838738 RepID=A0A9D2JX65_9BACT|nr:exodeoxyribonuclease VII small subunit [Candidatus Prevotella avicola]